MPVVLLLFWFLFCLQSLSWNVIGRTKDDLAFPLTFFLSSDQPTSSKGSLTSCFVFSKF